MTTADRYKSLAPFSRGHALEDAMVKEAIEVMRERINGLPVIHCRFADGSALSIPAHCEDAPFGPAASAGFRPWHHHTDAA